MFNKKMMIYSFVQRLDPITKEVIERLIYETLSDELFKKGIGYSDNFWGALTEEQADSLIPKLISIKIIPETLRLILKEFSQAKIRTDIKWVTVIETSKGWKIFIEDPHGEYAIPKNQSVVQIEEWNGYNEEDKLETHSRNSSEDYEDIKNQLAELLKKRLPDWHGDYSDNREAVFTRIHSLQFKEDSADLLGFVFDWYQQIIKAITTSGGDDDFYDYMPTFVWMFKQFCAALSIEKVYQHAVIWGVQASGRKVEEFDSFPDDIENKSWFIEGFKKLNENID
jgi:hypothetical protein